jgi:tRNA(adenine34) deaminase
MPIHHNKYMKLALSEAKKAGEKAEVPIGAVLVSQAGDILAISHNQTISLNDPTAHAEILTLREAAHEAQNYRLLNTILYVTIEPCVMCMGALVHARITQLVYGATDPKWGGAGSLYNLADDKRLNHRIEIIGGVCEDDCRALMQDFFQSKRK